MSLLQHLKVDRRDHPNFINKPSHAHLKINLLHGDDGVHLNPTSSTVSIIKRDWLSFLEDLDGKMSNLSPSSIKTASRTKNLHHQVAVRKMRKVFHVS